jgi:hypothetical protein
MYDGNVEIIAVSEIYEVSVSVYFGSEGHITRPSTVTVGQFVTKEVCIYSLVVN